MLTSSNFRQQEENHIMENILYLELIKRGYSVDVGNVDIYSRDKTGCSKRILTEVDFVANKGNNRIYIQSAFTMDSNEKEAQEKKSPLNIEDFF